jgi:hypothetical protein
MNLKNRILEINLKGRSNKILGVGLPKTGTTSLKEALTILGYRTVHTPRQYTYAQSLNIPFCKWGTVVSSVFKNKNILKSFPEVEVLKNDLKISDWDAMVNFGEHTYPLLDKELPNSKFILTIRDKKSWLKSVESSFKTLPEQTGYNDRCLGTVRILHIYHYISYNEDYFSILYDNHLRNVKHYFKDREQDLLTIDICGGEGWSSLCSFLEKDIPDISFPYENRTYK